MYWIRIGCRSESDVISARISRKSIAQTGCSKFYCEYKVVKTHRKHIKETQQSKIKDFLVIFLISKVKYRSLQLKIVTVDNSDFFAVSKQKTLFIQIFKWAGNGLLFHALRRNTIGAESFHVRVRNGIVCSPLALTTSPPNNL